MKERLSLAGATLIILYGCATLTTPTGGPKDVQKPYLTLSNPRDNSTNFKGKSITLTFNEPVKLNNPKEEIIISPSPGKREIKVKGNSVVITPEQGWQDSTTYSIFPRDGIQDITESNPADSSKLAFSTGPEIDSMKLVGKVNQLLTGASVEKISVGLYQQDTFNIFTDTARYFTKTDKKGRFRIDNIKPGTYKIYAFDDKNKNLRVDSRTERYTYLTDTIDLRTNSIYDTIRLGLINLDARPIKINSIRNVGNLTRVRLNKSSTEYTIKADSDIVNSYGDDQAEVVLYHPLFLNDSIPITLSAKDSIETTFDSTFYIKKTNIKPVKTQFKIRLGTPVIDSETLQLKSQFTFSESIATINFDSLFIKVDTTATIPITKENITINPIKRTIDLDKKIDDKFVAIKKDSLGKDLPSRKLTLYSGLAAMVSVENDSSPRTAAPIEILRFKSTGILFIEVNTREKNYIIQLLDRDFHIIKELRNERKYTYRNLTPGDYQLRVIIDSNNNGRWDPGNFLRGQAPEKITFYHGALGKQLFPIRANWELGPLIIRF
ncbi:MAG TPA: Ig-like domain-containing domain [Cyclobacteriaceae bacterium]|nr:Ig-like domain-containing domain [Cyclobacteriaceae bacterium]